MSDPTVQIESPWDVRRRADAMSRLPDGASWTDYRATFRTLDGSDPVDSVAAELRDWLANHRRLNVSVEDGSVHDDGERRFEISYVNRGDSRDVKALLTEASEQGVWSTTVRATASGSVGLEVRNSEGRFVAVPNLTRALLQRLDLGDAGHALAAHPAVWGVDEVDELVELLVEPARSSAVFVAALGDEQALVEPFTANAREWFKQTYGLAQPILLTADAMRETAYRLGAHAVMPWSIRTFLPQLKLGDSLDARRHRYLMAATLNARRPQAVAQLLGGIARSQTNGRPLPFELRDSESAFARDANRRLADQVRSKAARRPEIVVPPPTPPAPPTKTSEQELAPVTSEADRLLALVGQYLGLTQVTEESLEGALASLTEPAVDEGVSALEERLDSLQDKVESQARDIDLLEDLLEEEQLETGIVDEETSKLRSEVQWLRSQLREVGQYDLAAQQAEPEPAPADMGVLVDRLPQDIVFTGDRKAVEDVVERDPGSCVAVAWDAVLAMADFLRAVSEGRIEGNFHRYVTETPSGFRTFAPAKSAENETGTTQRQFGSERIFPVPDDVVEGGRVMMNAHIRLGRIGRASPRMHYYYDSGSARIFIGYIGLHLTNTQTN